MDSLVVMVTLLLAGISANQACMCMPEHPQKHFCGADFVIRARVINATDGSLPTSVPEHWRKHMAPVIYNLRIEKIFKGEEAIKKSEGVEEYGPKSTIEASLLTPSRGISCHVPLTSGRVYLLTGRIRDGKLRTDFCHWRRLWHRVTASQRAGIRHNYSPNCQCQVGPCYGPHCGELLKGCGRIEWFPRLKEPCKRMYTFCKAVSDKACQWVNTAQYSRCWDDMP